MSKSNASSTFNRIVFSAVLLLLAGCQTAAVTPTSPQAPTKTQPVTSPTEIGLQPSPTIVITHPELEPITPENVHRLELIDQWGIGHVHGMDLSPDGTTIAVGTNTGIYLYSAQTGKQTGFIDLPIAKKSMEKGGCIFQSDNLAYSPDGKYLAIGDIELTLWDLKLNDIHSTIRNPEGLGNNYVVTKLQFGPDGNQIVVAWAKRTDFPCEVGGGMFSIHDIQSGSSVYKKEFRRYVRNYDFNVIKSDTTYFLYWENDLKISVLIEVVTSTGRGTNHQLSRVGIGDFHKFDLDGLWFVAYQAVYKNDNHLTSSHIIDLKTAEEINEVPFFLTPLPNSDNFLIYHDEIWEIQTIDGEKVCEFSYLGEEEFSPEFQDYWDMRTGYEAATGSIDPFDFSADGKTAISHGWRKSMVWVWDFETCTISDPELFFPETIWELGFSNDGQILFSGGGYIWDVTTGEPNLGDRDWESNISCHDDIPSPDGQIVTVMAHSLFSGNLDLKDTTTDEVLINIDTGSFFVCIDRSFSPDGRILATLGSEGIINLWGVKKP